MKRLLAVLLLTAAACSSSHATGSPTPTPSGSVDASDAEPVAAPDTSTAASAVPSPSVAATGHGVTLTQVGRLTGPVALAMRPHDSAPWIVEQRGTVQRLVGGKGSKVLDLTAEIDTDGSERGLLGIAFSPDGSTLYLDGTVKPHADTRVWAYPVAADGTIDTAHRTTLLEQVQPYPNHNGGNLVIGPDGMLYVGLGDGGSAGDPQRHGQDLSTDLGKILRLDPSLPAPHAPADNPFVSTPKARPEIWLYGVRNPWRFSFDTDGSLWIGDVGQDSWEEIDHLPAGGKGANLGWSAFEGDHPFNADQKAPGAVKPVYEYDHKTGCSVTGGYVYRGSNTSLQGRYVYSDYCAGGVWALSKDGTTSTQLLTLPRSVSSFGQGADGTLYVLSTSGGVYTVG